MRLSTRIVLGTVVLVLLAALAFAFFSYRALERSIYPAQLSRMAGDALLMVERLGATVDEAVADVAVNAHAPATVGLVQAMAANDAEGTTYWNERLAQLFMAQLTAKPEYTQLRFIAALEDGREIVRVDRAAENGSVRAVPESELQTKGFRPYVEETLSLPSGSFYVSPIELNQEFGAIQEPHMPVIRVATPVSGPDGKHFGLIIINVDLQPAFDRLRAAAGSEVSAYVVNASGDYLVHPDRSVEFGFELGRPARLQEDHPSLAAFLQPPPDGAITTQTIEDGAGESFAAAAAGQFLGGGTWVGVFLLAPHSVVLAPADQTLFSVLIAGAITIIVAVLLAAAFSRSVSRPLSTLAQAITRYDRGETVGLPRTGPREVVQLVDTFRRHIERERLFNAAVQSSSDAIITMTLGGTITAWNGAAEALYGYSAEDAVGKPVSMLVPDDRRAEFDRTQAALRSGEATAPFETERLNKERQRRLVSLSQSPVRSLNGELVGASEISRDITAQKEAEAMFRLAVEASPAAMIMVDASGNIALANSETLSMFGYARGDLVGRPVEQLVPQRLRDDHSVLRRDFLAAPTRRMMGKGRELFGLRADGTEFPVEVGLSPIESPSGPMMLSVVVDITERKRAGEELARRTEDLQRSNAELQQFAYVTSHDLQEPLRMVSSFCELLKNRYGHQLEGEALEYVDFAVDGAQRMRQLINDLLDYSRLKTREVRFSAVPAKAAVESALFNLSASISETAAEIEVGELPSVSGHEGQLTHLFQNLIGNALKFRKSGEAPAVEISARRHGEAWQFTVADNGIGFDPKHADAVFGVFQRLHTRDEYPGTGIGLAMCKRIVEQHGGDIWVESSPSQGAAFHFTLMPAETISRDPATELSAETSSGSEEGSGHVRRAS